MAADNIQDQANESYPDELDEVGLDDFLEAEAPEFTESLRSIASDKEITAQDIDLIAEQEIQEEYERWQNSVGFRKTVFRVFPFAPRLAIKVRHFKFKLKSWALGTWVRARNFFYFLVVGGRHHLVRSSAQVIKFFADGISSTLGSFEKFSAIRKTFAILFVAAAVGTGLLIYRISTRGVIPKGEALFIPSMAAVASQTYTYDPESDVESLYDNLRATQNLFLLPKIFVNLRRSPRSSSSPMAAMELFIEGADPEVLIEMKDRQARTVDAVQRVIEEFSFEQLDTGEGKREMCDRIKKEINALLTSGSVKRVLIKTIVIKP